MKILKFTGQPNFDSPELNDLSVHQAFLRNSIQSFCFAAINSGEFHNTEDIESEIQDECIEAGNDILGNCQTIFDFGDDE